MNNWLGMLIWILKFILFIMIGFSRAVTIARMF